MKGLWKREPKAPYLVTEEEHRALRERLREQEQKHRAAIRELSLERGAASEDNTELAESQREADACEERCRYLRDVLKKSKKVIPPKTNERLLIGTIATIQRFDKHDEPIGPPVRYEIVGFDSANLKADPPQLSYTAPLLDGLFKRRVDPDRGPVPVLGQNYEVELIAIELPSRLSLVPSEAETKAA